ncbi:PEGA domain-containing protein [Candidatus Woesearchaeota archaeon]|nr:PEGA domain-containing protein [Candidatus Woesearchaeota archaeon]
MNLGKKQIMLTVFLLLAAAIVPSLLSEKAIAESGCCYNPNAPIVACSSTVQVDSIQDCCPQPEASFPTYYSAEVQNQQACLQNFFRAQTNCNTLDQCTQGCCCPESRVRARALCRQTFHPFANGQPTDCQTACATTPPIQTCSLSLNAINIKGEKQIQLVWNNNCGADTFTIERCEGNNCNNFAALATWHATSYLDRDSAIKWNQYYSYRLTTTANGQTYTETKTIYSGDIECWKNFGTYNFCISDFTYQQEPIKSYLITILNYPADDTAFSQKVNDEFGGKFRTARNCNTNNQLSSASTRCPAGRICTVDSNGAGRCVETTECSVIGKPFGLFSSRTSCETGHYCFLDKSAGNANTCYDCSPRMSCYDYKSRDACETNNCGAGNCVWNTVGNAELGTGVCVDYQKNNCAWCDKKGTEGVGSLKGYNTVFDRCSQEKTAALSTPTYDCTRAVRQCTSTCLNFDINQCNAHTATIDRSTNSLVISNPPGDLCGLNVCQWYGTETAGRCRKDADFDERYDCQTTDCEKDYFPPETTITENRGSLIADVFDRRAVDDYGGFTTTSTTYICSSNDQARGCADTTQGYTALTQRSSSILELVRQNTLTEGTNYIRYYSKDQNKNLETVKRMTLQVTIPVDGSLTLTATDASTHENLGADTYIDRLPTSAGTTPLTIYHLIPGSHTYRITKQGYTDGTGDVTIIAGETATRNIEMSQTVDNNGRLAVSVTDSETGDILHADVYMDSSAATSGTTPLTIPGLTPGAHSYRIAKQGYTDSTGSITITERQITYLSATLGARNPQTGYLSITATDKDTNTALNADAYIDESTTPAGTTPLTTSLSQGTHRYRIAKTGYRESSGTVTINQGQATQINVQLEFIPVPGTGVLSMSASDGTDSLIANVYLDDSTTPAGTTPLTTSLQPNTHTYKVTKTGYQDSSGSFTIQTGRTTTVSVLMTRSANPPNTGGVFIRTTDSITGNPVNANAYIDSSTTPSTTPTTISGLTPGTHSYRITKQGYNDNTGTITIESGQTVTLSAQLSPATTPPAGNGNLAIKAIDSASSEPVEADTYIDGATTTSGTTPITIHNLAPGAHTYRIAKTNYKDIEGRVEVTAGTTTYLIVSMIPPIPTSTGNLFASATDSLNNNQLFASIYIDGATTPAGTTPLTITRLTAGNHNYRISKTGYQDSQGSIQINAGDTATLNMQLRPVSSTGLFVTATDVLTQQSLAADVYMDSSAATSGTTPVSIPGLQPGRHTYKITKSGYKDYNSQIDIQAGQAATANAIMELVTAPNSGNLSIIATDGNANIIAEVSINRAYRGTTPLTINLQPGIYTYAITKQGYDDAMGEATVTAGRTAYITANLNPAYRPSELTITLIEPKLSATSQRVYNLVIRTNKEADCKASFLADRTYEDMPLTFTQGNNGMRSLNDYSGTDEKTYVKCRDREGTIRAAEFNIQYLGTPPSIRQIYADNVNDVPIASTMTAITDQQTVCKYSKSQEAAYSGMTPFLGYNENSAEAYKLVNKHNLTAAGGDLIDRQTNTFYVMCQNKAGVLSTKVPVSIIVDTNQEPTITPDYNEYYPNTTVEFGVITNKWAKCKYSNSSDYSDYRDFSSVPTMRIKDRLTLYPGSFTYYIRCVFLQGAVRETSIHFVVDITPPTSPKVEVENITSRSIIKAKWKSEDNESGIKLYQYSVTNSSNNTILDWTSTSQESQSITGLELANGTTYYVSAKAQNNAGQFSRDATGIGVKANFATSTSCQNGVKDEGETDIDCGGRCSDQCGNMMKCRNNDDCQSSYCALNQTCYQPTCYDKVRNGNESGTDCGGRACRACESGNECNSDSDCRSNHCISGMCTNQTSTDTCSNSKIDYGETDIDCGGVCASVKNKKCEDGKTCTNETDCQSEKCIANTCASIDDRDGDGIPDSKDNCPDAYNPDQKDTNNAGIGDACNKDIDGDGMDDEWEKKYTCLDITKRDSTTDPDNDTMSNIREYQTHTIPNGKKLKGQLNPCKKDTDGDGFEDGTEYNENSDPTDANSKPENHLLLVLLWAGAAILILAAGYLILTRLARKPAQTPQRTGMQPGTPTKPPIQQPRTPIIISPKTRQAIIRKRETGLASQRSEILSEFEAKPKTELQAQKPELPKESLAGQQDRVFEMLRKETSELTQQSQQKSQAVQKKRGNK